MTFRKQTQTRTKKPLLILAGKVDKWSMLGAAVEILDREQGHELINRAKELGPFEPVGPLLREYCDL